jgi:hypothetical protein
VLWCCFYISAAHSAVRAQDLPGGDASNGNYLWLWEVSHAPGLRARDRSPPFSAGHSTERPFLFSTLSTACTLCWPRVARGSSQCNGGDSQRWSLDGTQIKLTANPSFCIDLPGGDVRNGNRLWLWECNGATNQQWTTAQHLMRSATHAAQQRGSFSNATPSAANVTRSGGHLPNVTRSGGHLRWLGSLFRSMRDRAMRERNSSAVRARPATPWQQHTAVHTWYANQSRMRALPRRLERH